MAGSAVNATSKSPAAADARSAMKRILAAVAAISAALLISGCSSNGEPEIDLAAEREKYCEAFARVTPGILEIAESIKVLSDETASTKERSAAMEKQMDAAGRENPYDCNSEEDQERFDEYFAGAMAEKSITVTTSAPKRKSPDEIFEAALDPYWSLSVSISKSVAESVCEQLNLGVSRTLVVSVLLDTWENEPERVANLYEAATTAYCPKFAPVR
ncbi:outer membrane murein-binding lipoprotein Lpp [Rhodococcus sp. 27YEA15]|uniref:DUF732 domain-containing protein n=1 Tax=Rhodococcus sp. 27YEA15 TaxID=3156259 RepID=UPI003C7C3E97